MEYKVLHDHLDIYKELKDITGNYQVVVEDYRANIKTKDQAYAMKLVGFIEGLCKVRGIKCTMQMPSQRKGYLKQSKETLRGYGCNVTHIIDSYAHVLRYIDKVVKRRKPNEYS